MRRHLFGITTLLALVSPAFAGTNVTISPGMSQPEFHSFSENLGAALSYKDLAPAAPLGASGIDFGITTTHTQIQDAGAWQAGTGGTGNSLTLPTLYADKGLPFGLDIGGSYTALPNSNIRLLGARVSYSLLSGNSTLPAVALRATYTKLSGVNQLDFSTRGLELAFSKRFGTTTPYAGLGRIWVSSTPNNALTLAPDHFYENKAFIGVNMNLGMVDLAVEGDHIGSDNSISAKIGLRF